MTGLQTLHQEVKLLKKILQVRLDILVFGVHSLSFAFGSRTSVCLPGAGACLSPVSLTSLAAWL